MSTNNAARSSLPNRSILIVDDEGGIRRSLEGILQDEGFEPMSEPDGESALRRLAVSTPSLVLLDIWMPGMDGVETLRRIKALHPSLPVIMMSGHASIATAIEATRLGASDFIEKPLDMESTLRSVKKVLGLLELVGPSSEDEENTATAASLSITKRSGVKVNPVVFAHQALKGELVPQHTLRSSALLYGQGLHSGRKSGIMFEPLPPNSGIHFAGVSDATAVPAHVSFVQSTGFATTIRLGETRVGTIEHIMSALHAFGISNLLIKCNGEVPVMDGSSQEFGELFGEIGIEEQSGEWYEIKIPRTIRIGSDKEWIQFEPGEKFTIDYTLSYPDPVGTQHMVFTLDDVGSYMREIAPARTFGFVKDIGMLQRQGLALGGRFDNFILMGKEGPINGSLRYTDECVRHKILDAIGDLYLLGRTFRGKVTARMTGHSDNIQLLQALLQVMEEEG